MKQTERTGDDVTLERSSAQSRDETLAMAARELKTPLAIIKGSATTLLSNSIRWDATMQREMLQMIDTQADRLHEILNTLLEVWRLDASGPNLHLNQAHLPEVPALPARRGQLARIAVVEGDARIARYLRANLEELHYQVQVLNRGAQFLHQFDLEEPDLVLLATNLEDSRGIELLQRLREFSHVPVVMLCDTDDEDERVHLLDLGADDLVSKPFSMKELLARLRVLLRRQAAQTESEPGEAIFTTGDLLLDYAQHQVLLHGHPVQLSRTEYKLLSTLAQNAGRVLTHELLLERVWGAEYNREVDFIWVYISRLRRKIEADSRHPRYIVTVPDVGYKLVKIE
jgi:DNA-binding response OmpR family regulator